MSAPKTIARGVGHNVVISGVDGVKKTTIGFRHSPICDVLLDENNIITVSPGECEIAVGDIHYRRSVPKGHALVHKDRIFIAGVEIIQIALASVSQRVEHLVQEGNWEMALSQISSPGDISVLLHDYADSDALCHSVLFATVERLWIIDFIVKMSPPKRRQEIIRAFAESGISRWTLTLDFVMEVIATTRDDEKLVKFLSTVELSLDWLPPFSRCASTAASATSSRASPSIIAATSFSHFDSPSTPVTSPPERLPYRGNRRPIHRCCRRLHPRGRLLRGAPCTLARVAL